MRYLLQVFLSVLLLAVCDTTYAQCDGVIPVLCDADGDRDVDSDDISLIGALKGEPAGFLPDAIVDIDGDGVITGLDARQCVAQ